MPFDDDDEREQLRYEQAQARLYRATLVRHPDPRDPDHPEMPRFLRLEVEPRLGALLRARVDSNGHLHADDVKLVLDQLASQDREAARPYNLDEGETYE